MSPPQLEALYVSVLYTIQHMLGGSTADQRDELLCFVQEAFGVNQKLHEELLATAVLEKVNDELFFALLSPKQPLNQYQ